MSEFTLIEAVRRRVGAAGAGVTLGIGDDAAVLRVPSGHELVATTDTLIEDVHFFADVPPFDLGHKCLAVNLSDLAAMGASPRWALLSLSLPRADTTWLDAFLEGFLSLARQHEVSLVGGDTCRSPATTLTVTALGVVETGSAIRRDGARPGDLVVVSGELGSAGLALEQMRAGRRPERGLRSRLTRPQPRVNLGRALVGNATACIDLSDGLSADLQHVADASGCAAVVELAKMPGHEALMAVPCDERWNLQLNSGDDYELCFTWPAEGNADLAGIALSAGVALTVVGTMQRGAGVQFLTAEGEAFAPAARGFDHFHE